MGVDRPHAVRAGVSQGAVGTFPDHARFSAARDVLSARIHYAAVSSAGGSHRVMLDKLDKLDKLDNLCAARPVSLQLKRIGLGFPGLRRPI